MSNTGSVPRSPRDLALFHETAARLLRASGPTGRGRARDARRPLVKAAGRRQQRPEVVVREGVVKLLMRATVRLGLEARDRSAAPVARALESRPHHPAVRRRARALRRCAERAQHPRELAHHVGIVRSNSRRAGSDSLHAALVRRSASAAAAGETCCSRFPRERIDHRIGIRAKGDGSRASSRGQHAGRSRRIASASSRNADPKRGACTVRSRTWRAVSLARPARCARPSGA